MLTAIRALPVPTPEAVEAKRKTLRYLKARQEQIRYAHFQQLGYPIGSGVVESACKLVVEARLKGSRVPAGGCHWAPHNVNPLLALRSRLCSGQWTQTWSAIWQAWRAQVCRQRAERRERRRAKHAAHEPASSIEPVALEPKQERVKTIIDGHPTADHPWNQDDYLPHTWAYPPKL